MCLKFEVKFQPHSRLWLLWSLRLLRYLEELVKKMRNNSEKVISNNMSKVAICQFKWLNQLIFQIVRLTINKPFSIRILYLFWYHEVYELCKFCLLKNLILISKKMFLGNCTWPHPFLVYKIFNMAILLCYARECCVRMFCVNAMRQDNQLILPAPSRTRTTKKCFYLKPKTLHALRPITFSYT